MNFIFRLLLTFNATSLLLIIFFVQQGYTLNCFLSDVTYSAWTAALPNCVSYFFYLTIPILLTGLSIWLSKYLGEDEFKEGRVASIEYANNSFLPSYLGYFFVALSINNYDTLCFVYGVLFVFTFLSQALYFNPLFLLFGYQFYNITTKNGTAIFLISKERYKTPSDIKIAQAYRINDYTFIEQGK